MPGYMLAGSVTLVTVTASSKNRSTVQGIEECREGELERASIVGIHARLCSSAAHASKIWSTLLSRLPARIGIRDVVMNPIEELPTHPPSRRHLRSSPADSPQPTVAPTKLGSTATPSRSTSRPHTAPAPMPPPPQKPSTSQSTRQSPLSPSPCPAPRFRAHLHPSLCTSMAPVATAHGPCTPRADPVSDAPVPVPTPTPHPRPTHLSPCSPV
ncbi:hypothetical protein OF83DRAFT_1178452 [Amylostereum chailletii]|nr:hypothetical protein OF83DRAFT_1178452 [Amylostereum chailletii]